MTHEEIFEIIKKEIIELYGDSPSKDAINSLAETLSEIITDNEKSMDEISEIYSFEDKLTDLDNSKFFDLSEKVIDLIPINKIGADKLYDYFMNSVNDFTVLVKLMNNCKDFLSNEQYEKLKQEASEIYDEDILRLSIYDWDED